MPSRIPFLLTDADFSQAERDALRLDGDVYAVDRCAAPLDLPATPLLRASALKTELPPKLIVERLSAAWIWGAWPFPPTVHQVCSDTTARTRPGFGSHLEVREVVISSADIAELGGLRLTTPVRTAIDIARFTAQWTEREASVVADLMHIGGFDVSDCARVMNRRRNLPGKMAALHRLSDARATQTTAGEG